MPSLENIEIKEGCAYYRPAGSMTLDSFVAILRQGMEACRENGVKKLLVDSTRLSGKPFTIAQQYEAAAATAAFWDVSIKLAIVSTLEAKPPDDFAMLVARNRAMNVNGFTSEQAAVAWLTD